MYFYSLNYGNQEIWETKLIAYGAGMSLSFENGWPIRTSERQLRVPTRTGKPGEMGRHFPVREKSGNFEQTGKVRENHTKYWKTEIN